MQYTRGAIEGREFRLLKLRPIEILHVAKFCVDGEAGSGV